MSRIFATLVAVATTAGLSACTVKKTEAPSLSGPSETGLSFRTTITPDILEHDGRSQSQIEIVARGPDSRPARGVSMRIELVTPAGELADYGRLSTRTVVTGDDGIARLSYTAPPPLREPVDPYYIVTVLVTPISSDFAGSATRSVEVRLVPPGHHGPILGVNNPPVPAIRVTPTPVTTYTSATFSATETTDEGVPCGSNCSYAWDFGDGTSGTGIVVSHEYRSVGTYAVALTVTDVRGLSRTRYLDPALSVTASPAPTAAFTFSPTEPRFGQQVFFNAAASTAGGGRRLVAYDWDFGTGRTGTGMTVAKGYGPDLIPPGAVSGDTVTFNVTLTVHDDTFAPTGVGVVTTPVAIKVP